MKFFLVLFLIFYANNQLLRLKLRPRSDAESVPPSGSLNRIRPSLVRRQI